MFRFVTRYLGFMKAVPLAPHIFDALLKLQTAVLRPSVLNHVDTICDEISGWPGVSVSLHKYGGIQFNYQGRELGHVHGNGLADILLNKSKAKALVADHKALPHHTYKNSGWVSYYIRDRKSMKEVLGLFRLARGCVS